MNIRQPPPEGVIEAQSRASDPATSAWVSANAGSGKTHVLVQRVVRLLLDGADPGKILCLTFTKAAAATMANRVFETLAKWTALDDAALAAEIAKLDGRKPSPSRRLRARRLFAQALETPGGLKVQTIHAFCAALLGQFPFEAGVPSRFEVLEERAEAETIDRLRLDVLREAAQAPGTPLGDALATAIVAAADATFADVVREAIAQRDKVSGWLARAGGVPGAVAELTRTLGLAPGETLAAIEAEFFASPYLARDEWPAVIAVLLAGKQSDLDHVERFRLAQRAKATEGIEPYLAVFCTKDREPRKFILTKGLRDKNPDLAERMGREQDRVCALLVRRRAAILRDRTAALITVVDAVLRRYRAEKDRRGLLDFNDLVGKTLALLESGVAAWVHYKLDLGIDHVLVDEAQDTSPAQWEVIRHLTAEFTAGAGARENAARSVFAVGDEKQSIYSFQGAAPHRFDEMRRYFETAHLAAERPFAPVAFRYSFRSAPAILEAVDEVFSRPEAYVGLTADRVPTVHEAVRREAPGCVEIWEPETADETEETEGWDAPFDAVSEQSPQARLAHRIAKTVRALTTRGDHLSGKPLAPGNVLVLVRQRGPLFEAIIRALKEADVSVAGADRLVLTEHIAVMDLLSLGDALLLEEDDLALAEALKSPLFGLDDDALFTLAWERKGTLRASLRAHAHASPAFATAAEMLNRLEREARAQSPFSFYAHLLGPGGGRRMFLARLGPEAADALDEFLALALEYEARQTPSLQGFIAWMRAAEVEVKRDMDIARDEVRVMTVHGAKGLEAPLVILADTMTRPAGPRDPSLLALELPELPPGAVPPLVWVAAREGDVAVVRDARERARVAAEHEHRRLLYVALTRAADRLIVCGAHGVRSKPDGCWYDLVRDALGPHAREVPGDVGPEPVLRWEKAARAGVQSAMRLDPPSAAAEAPPPWLRQAAPDASSRPAVSPSRAARMRPGTDMARSGSGSLGQMRGRLVHRLLQSLPELPEAERAVAARRFLVRQGHGLDAEVANAILREVEGVLRNEAFAPLFGPGTRAEVPLVGRLSLGGGDARAVAGQVDRLAVTPDTVLIADYKTDRVPPRDPARIPQPYLVQLALYRALLAALYPGRAVRAAIVWTETPALMEVPPSLLDGALTELCRTPDGAPPLP